MQVILFQLDHLFFRFRYDSPYSTYQNWTYQTSAQRVGANPGHPVRSIPDTSGEAGPGAPFASPASAGAPALLLSHLGICDNRLINSPLISYTGPKLLTRSALNTTCNDSSPAAVKSSAR
jgi:hypothetical protein